MTRILAAVLLCAASSIGCSAVSGLNSRGPIPAQHAMNQSAPRPVIQRTAYDQPSMGVTDMQCNCPGLEGGCGEGMCGCCTGVVDDMVSCAIDCNGAGCGDACGGYGGCQGGCQGGCYGGGCQGGLGACSCGGRGHCACCRKLCAILRAGCICGGQGQCPCCQHLKTMIGGPIMGRTDAIYNFNPGPPAAQTAYPYYTTRGPRDFFLDNPPSIGPY